MSFVGDATTMNALNTSMVTSGFALRVVGDPTNTWVGSSSTSIATKGPWGLGPGPSQAPSDKFVTFDAATAGNGGAATVDTDHNLRGLYFLSTAATGDGFAFGGTNTLITGRGGMTNYDNSRQVFNANLSLGDSQYWDGGSGGVTLNTLNTNGKLLEITGTGLNRITGTVSGSGALAVSGGTLELTGANTYTGKTWVHQGTLLANNLSGSATGTGNLEIAAGATLAGAGSISSSTVISGTLAPGNSIGTLNIANDVTWNAGNAWIFELGTFAASLEDARLGLSSQDLLLITGTGSDFLKGSGSGWTFDFAATGENGWYRLVDWDGSTDFLASDFAALNLASGKSVDFLIDSDSSALYLNVIPESSSTLLLAVSLAFLLRRRR